MKKFIAAIAAFTLITPSVFAADNFEQYNKYVYMQLKPAVGLCDINASFAGHEVDYSDVNDYFGGLISAMNIDLDGDGNDELVTIESKNVNVYSVENGKVVSRGSIAERLIGNDGESYANVFIKNNGAKNYLGIEKFFAGGGQNCYQLELFTVENSELKSEMYIYHLAGDGEVYESVSQKGMSIFSHTEGNGLSTLSDPNNYVSIYMAAQSVLSQYGINEKFLDRYDRIGYTDEAYLQKKTDNYGKDHKISASLTDITPITYIYGTGVRTAQRPIVIFYDSSRLNDFLKEVYDIKVKLNGNEISFPDQEPMIKDGRTLVPVRAIFEALGAEVSWLPSAQKVVANTADTNITMTIDRSEYFVNGEKKYLDVPAMLINGRTMVPARASAEGFGCKVDWDDASKTVLITK